jgi:acyl-ACP thioesterase
VRRTEIRIDRFPRFEEPLTLTTWASGAGRMWAERHTSIAGCVEAAALWVHIDPASARPLPLPDAFDDIYGPSTEGRRVKARLRHPGPPAGAPGTPWLFRRSDLDVADHVNNAAYWCALEELVPLPPEPVTAEIEFRAPAPAGEARVLAGDGIWWIASPDGEVHTSLTLST